MILLDSDEYNYHMPAFYGSKILFCAAFRTDEYLEDHGRLALTQRAKKTKYNSYNLRVADLDKETGEVSNIKILDCDYGEQDIYCSPHAYKRKDGLTEMTFIRGSVLGGIKLSYQMIKRVYSADFEEAHSCQRVLDCFVSDCYFGVENERFRACGTPVITKPYLFIYDKVEQKEYKIAFGGIYMIRRVSFIEGETSKIIITCPDSAHKSVEKWPHRSFIVDIEDLSVQEIIVPNEAIYKCSVDSQDNIIYSENLCTENEYKMRIKMAKYTKQKAIGVFVKAGKKFSRPYMWV